MKRAYKRLNIDKNIIKMMGINKILRITALPYQLQTLMMLGHWKTPYFNLKILKIHKYSSKLLMKEYSDENEHKYIYNHYRNTLNERM